jgi:branched-subunit amino acid transport protein AzlD
MVRDRANAVSVSRWKSKRRVLNDINKMPVFQHYEQKISEGDRKMILSPAQTIIIICMVAIGTMITRFLPFVLFKGTSSNNSYITYLGKVLPYSAIGLLVVYCLKDVSFKSPSFGLPEIISISVITALHNWKKNTLLSIGAGTILYMVLVQFVFK